MLHLRTETTSTAFWTFVAHKNRDPRRGRSLADAHWNARLHRTFALKSSAGYSESEGWLRLLSRCTVDRLHRPHRYDPFINIGLRPSFCRACIFFPTCTSVYCLHGSKWRRINSVKIHLGCLCTEHVYAAPPEIANLLLFVSGLTAAEVVSGDPTGSFLQPLQATIWHLNVLEICVTKSTLQ